MILLLGADSGQWLATIDVPSPRPPALLCFSSQRGDLEFRVWSIRRIPKFVDTQKNRVQATLFTDQDADD